MTFPCRPRGAGRKTAVRRVAVFEKDSRIFPNTPSKHLIFEGTLDRFPGLKICAAHGGGYLGSYANRSDAVIRTFPNRVGPMPKKKPTQYLKDGQLFFDTIVFTPEALRHLIAESGVGQIMIGTDYPFPWTSTEVDLVLNTPGLSDADKIAILGGTATKLLGIK